MARPSKYSPELRERAVRLVHEHAHKHPLQWAAIRSVAEKLGCTGWRRAADGVRPLERDQGHLEVGARRDELKAVLHAYQRRYLRADPGVVQLELQIERDEHCADDVRLETERAAHHVQRADAECDVL
jgi:transposase-like protein